jgi:hypothetical protein
MTTHPYKEFPLAEAGKVAGDEVVVVGLVFCTNRCLPGVVLSPIEDESRETVWPV